MLRAVRDRNPRACGHRLRVGSAHADAARGNDRTMEFAAEHQLAALVPLLAARRMPRRP